MKKQLCCYFSLLCLLVLLTGCVPITFTPPIEIHITPGDMVETAVIAVDAAGRSHIAGVVNDRIVYYRTRYGEDVVKFTMGLGGSGTNWKQYKPDIAALDNGTVFVVWVEQRGGTDKFACYLLIPLLPPIGGYDKSCHALDGTEKTAGNVWVTARGDTAYAVYDRPYTDNVRTVDLWYKRITSLPPNSGRVHWFIEPGFETAHIYSLDLGIDSGGFLHVGYHYNWTTGGPYAERLELRSNRSVQPDGQMTQVWVILGADSIDQDIPVSLSFYSIGATEYVALASGYHPTTVDRIYISYCPANGCGVKADVQVNLPSSWDTFSIIDDVEILGIGTNLHLSFIGDDNTSPTGVEQIYFKGDAFSAAVPQQPSSGSATFKYDLEMTQVDARPESVATEPFPMMAWGESNLITNQFFVFDGLFSKVKVYETDLLLSLPIGEIASNGIYFSGVWNANEDTWFTTQAWINNLPLVLK